MMKMKKGGVVIIAILLVPNIALAAWWNPLSWFDAWSFLASSSEEVVEESKALETDLVEPNANSTTTASTTEKGVSDTTEQQSSEVVAQKKTSPETTVREPAPAAPSNTAPENSVETSASDRNTAAEEIEAEAADSLEKINWAYWEDVAAEVDEFEHSWYSLETETKSKPEEYGEYRSHFTSFSPYVTGTVAENIANRGYKDFTKLKIETQDFLEQLEKLTDSFKDFKRAVDERDAGVETKYEAVQDYLDEAKMSYTKYKQTRDDAFATYKEFKNALEDLRLIDTE